MVHPDQSRVVDQSGWGTDPYLRCSSAMQESYTGDVHWWGRSYSVHLKQVSHWYWWACFQSMVMSVTDHTASWWHTKWLAFFYLIFLVFISTPPSYLKGKKIKNKIRYMVEEWWINFFLFFYEHVKCYDVH